MKLFIRSVDDADLCLEKSLEEAAVTLGRDPDCDVVIPNMLASRQHCRIEFDGSDILLTDLESQNGTLVNGDLVEQTVLKSGDVITIGISDLEIEFGPEQSTERKQSSRRSRTSSTRDVLNSLVRVYSHSLPVPLR